jgi:hypothetical protein
VQSLVVSFLLGAAATQNALVVLGVSLICTVFMLVLLGDSPGAGEALFRQQFREDFMSLVATDELGMDNRWRAMDKQTLEELEAEDWSLTHQREHWRPRLDEVSPQQAIEATDFDLNL